MKWDTRAKNKKEKIELLGSKVGEHLGRIKVQIPCFPLSPYHANFQTHETLCCASYNGLFFSCPRWIPLSFIYPLPIKKWFLVKLALSFPSQSGLLSEFMVNLGMYCSVSMAHTNPSLYLSTSMPPINIMFTASGRSRVLPPSPSPWPPKPTTYMFLLPSINVVCGGSWVTHYHGHLCTNQHPIRVSNF
jgi:hypothetical protein